MTDQVQWKDIQGYEGLYQVSNTGLVRSKKKELKAWKRSKYLLVDLWKNGQRDVRSIHYLVYEAFIGPITKGLMIHHIDSNKFNNNVSNLEMMSYQTHNKTHHAGKPSWNKGLKMSPEVHKKAWETRRRKQKC